MRQVTARRFLDVVEISETGDVAAGEFSAWLAEVLAALADGRGVRVPCGDCTACCRSSYFVHIGAEETATLARVPAELRFPAPGQPGAWVMGFDDAGQCPMLDADGCAIYEDRPLACRQFDCRVFAAAQVDPAADDKADIAERSRRWRFRYGQDDGSADSARLLHAAVAAAARYLDRHHDLLGDRGPTNRTQLAVLAVRVHPAFLALERASVETGRLPDAAALAGAVSAALRQLR